MNPLNQEEIAQMSDEELIEREATLHDKIYGHLTVYSTSDLRSHERLLDEMFERGMDVNPIEHRREDKALYPNKDVVRFERRTFDVTKSG